MLRAVGHANGWRAELGLGRWVKSDWHSYYGMHAAFAAAFPFTIPRVWGLGSETNVEDITSTTISLLTISPVFATPTMQYPKEINAQTK